LGTHFLVTGHRRDPFLQRGTDIIYYIFIFFNINILENYQKQIKVTK